MGKDLIMIFVAKACGFTGDNFAGEIGESTNKGELLIGYVKLQKI